MTELYSQTKQLFSLFVFWQNTAWQYFVALVVFLVSWVILKLILKAVIEELKRLAAKTATDIDDFVVRIFAQIKAPFYLAIALYLASLYLTIGGFVRMLFTLFVLGVVVYEVIRATGKILDFGMTKYLARQNADRESNASIIKTFRIMAEIVLWGVGILLILSNLGVNISSLVASLGIGGIAVALALQNILSDIFSSFSLYIDKPFQVGDFVIIGSDSGTVEKIGLKTTRIRSLQGEELVVSNQELTTARIQNFKKMERRRIVFVVNVEYGTPAEKLEKIPILIKEIVSAHSHATFERSHFKSYGEYNLLFETVYHVHSREYHVYMDLQQAINLAIYRAFENEGIQFALKKDDDCSHGMIS